MSGRNARRDLLKALAAAPMVVTLPSGAAVSQSSVSPECEAQRLEWNAGGPGISATCLTSFANSSTLDTLISG